MGHWPRASEQRVAELPLPRIWFCFWVLHCPYLSMESETASNNSLMTSRFFVPSRVWPVVFGEREKRPRGRETGATACDNEDKSTLKPPLNCLHTHAHTFFLHRQTLLKGVGSGAFAKVRFHSSVWVCPIEAEDKQGNHSLWYGECRQVRVLHVWHTHESVLKEVVVQLKEHMAQVKGCSRAVQHSGPWPHHTTPLHVLQRCLRRTSTIGARDRPPPEGRERKQSKTRGTRKQNTHEHRKHHMKGATKAQNMKSRCNSRNKMQWNEPHTVNSKGKRGGRKRGPHSQPTQRNFGLDRESKKRHSPV